jgi:hypothetical protein
MTKDKALRIALNALEMNQPIIEDYGYGEPLERHHKAITSIYEALETKDEPVAWMTINAYGDEDDIWYENPEGNLLEGWTYKPLYTTPQPKQEQGEPVEYWNAVEGWVKIDEVREHFESVSCGTIYKNGGEGRVPLYTTPQRTWVGLTDEEMNTALDYWSDDSRSSYGGAHAANGEYVDMIETWRYIEAKLKEKNNG